MWLIDIIRAKRWFIVSLLVTLGIPSAVLATMAHFAEEMSDAEALEVAQVAVKNYIDENPPRPGWKATKVYVDDQGSVVVDVHVPNFAHARVIQERNERIRYSYMKLACPPEDAWVYEWLGHAHRLMINLNHHGETLIKAPCPSNLTKGFLAG